MRLIFLTCFTMIEFAANSLLGRSAADALGASAMNFLLAVLVFVILPDRITEWGAVLAVLSGGVTSGLGYALWYRILPHLGAMRAAVAQISVPVIAMAGASYFWMKR